MQNNKKQTDGCFRRHDTSFAPRVRVAPDRRSPWRYVEFVCLIVCISVLPAIQPALAAPYEARAEELGFVPPPTLDNVRK